MPRCVRYDICDLHLRSMNDCMGGRGGTSPKIMFVGEAPSRTDAAVDAPFQGDIGRYIANILDELEIPPDDVRFTNLIRCHSDERTLDNVVACAPYLREEILSTNPGVIIPLGNTVLNYLFNMEGITKVRGQKLTMKLDGREFICIPTVHPNS